MGKRSRSKGVAGEREAVALLRPLFPGARRRSSGEEAQTNQGRDLAETPGFCFQVQKANPFKLSIHKKLREAMGAAAEGEIPAAITRQCSKTVRGEPWLVTMKLTDLVELLTK